MDLQEYESKLGEVFEFRKTLTPETDRGCALMAAAYLDSQLEDLLTLHFVDDPAVVEELLGQSKPLGSFSSRIDMAYVLGLIGPKARRDLHLIRKIRNLFGHEHKPLFFDEPKIANRCRELKYVWLEGNPRQNFIRAVMGVLAILHSKILKAHHIPVRQDRIIPELSTEELNDLCLNLKDLPFQDDENNV
jgi:DNA-binding MltR family transcriptional regulator